MECKFTQGFIAACAVTLRNHGCDTIVADTLVCCGPVSAERYRRLGVDEFDVEILLPVINEIKRKSAGVHQGRRENQRTTAALCSLRTLPKRNVIKRRIVVRNKNCSLKL